MATPPAGSVCGHDCFIVGCLRKGTASFLARAQNALEMSTVFGLLFPLFKDLPAALVCDLREHGPQSAGTDCFLSSYVSTLSKRDSSRMRLLDSRARSYPIQNDEHMPQRPEPVTVEVDHVVIATEVNWRNRANA